MPSTAAASTQPELCCPACRSRLAVDAKGQACAECGRHYATRDGVPSFTDADYYYGTLPRERTGELIRLAAEGRTDALRDALPRKGAKVFLRSFDESFADARFLLPIDRTTHVLDLGCGFGGLAFPIARTAGSVTAVDATFERVAFLARRAEAEGLANLHPFHADGLRLPFAPEQFGVALLNGVLEWVGEWDRAETPRAVQLRALRGLHDLLRPGGTLFVAIENRFGAELLYRRKDHNKLYWTSFLPRRLADLATRALKGKPYRTWTYDRRSLLALLAEAGFRDVRLFCPWPKYQDPATILPWGDTGAADYFRRTVLRKEHYLEYLLFSLLGRVGLDGFFSPAFIALARRS